MVRLGVGDVVSVMNISRMFQFQYGAIGRLNETTFVGIFKSFNSSMVRLGVELSTYHNVKKYVVSIPVWCDWE